MTGYKGLRGGWARSRDWSGLNHLPEILSHTGVFFGYEGHREPWVVACVTYFVDTSPEQGIWDFSASQGGRKTTYLPSGCQAPPTPPGPLYMQFIPSSSCTLAGKCHS